MDKARNRKEVGNIIGDDPIKAQAWVSRLINKGTLTEVLDHFDDKTRTPVYNYYYNTTAKLKRPAVQNKPRPIINQIIKAPAPKPVVKEPEPVPEKNVELDIPADLLRNGLSLSININFNIKD